MAEIEITEIWVSDRTRAKVTEKHPPLDADEVADMLIGLGSAPFRRRWSKENRKWKYLVPLAIDDNAHTVVLYPHVTGPATEWDLASVYPDD